MYRSDSRWYYAYHNWAKCPNKYYYVGIIEDNRYAGGRLESTIYRSISGDSARRSLRSYPYSTTTYRTTLLTRDQYNQLRELVAKGGLDEKFNIQEWVKNMSQALVTQTASKQAVMGKVVHVGWNMTDADIVWVSEDENECLGKLKSASRENPTKEYILLKPVKKVFQPVNVQEENL
jgi:hypothetical protein